MVKEKHEALINQSENQELFDIVKKMPKLLNSYIKSIGSEKRSVINSQRSMTNDQ